MFRGDNGFMMCLWQQKMTPSDKRVEATGRWFQKGMEIFCGPQIYPTTTLAHWWVTKEEPTCSYIPKDLPTGREGVKSGTEEESKWF